MRTVVSATTRVAVALALVGCGAAANPTLKAAVPTGQKNKYPPVLIGEGRCPRHQPPGLSASGNRSARHKLAPPGITSVELCRYGPITATGSHLQASRTLRLRSAIDALQTTLNALPSPPAGPINCASDDGAAIWLGLIYAAPPLVIESVQLQGCRDVSNGSVIATASGYGEPHDRPPPLKEQLIRLVPLHRRHPTTT